MISVWLSVCGWKAVESFSLIPSIWQNSFQNPDMNCGPRSETIELGGPWLR